MKKLFIAILTATLCSAYGSASEPYFPTKPVLVLTSIAIDLPKKEEEEKIVVKVDDKTKFFLNGKQIKDLPSEKGVEVVKIVYRDGSKELVDELWFEREID